MTLKHLSNAALNKVLTNVIAHLGKQILCTYKKLRHVKRYAHDVLGQAPNSKCMHK